MRSILGLGVVVVCLSDGAAFRGAGGLGYCQPYHHDTWFPEKESHTYADLPIEMISRYKISIASRNEPCNGALGLDVVKCIYGRGGVRVEDAEVIRLPLTISSLLSELDAKANE